MIRILPLINPITVFALKGGTAINFFVRDLPRISVDIDLAYLPVNERQAALADISLSLTKISGKIEKTLPGSLIVSKKFHGQNLLKGLIIRWNESSVKIETNPVIRGTVFGTRMKALSPRAQHLFEVSADIRTLSSAELYAGKICAALDRQHPRDLFDVNLLLKNEGVSEETKKAFLVYLISHPRPIYELLNPNFTDIRSVFENEFRGITVDDVGYGELVTTRERLVALIMNSLTSEDRQFLVSVKKGKPEWDLLGLENVALLPAVRWKLLNIGKMGRVRHGKSLARLEDYLLR
ncbi:MAG: nucleotidyl transferase AbiEii/AbiGii toxin family protein [Deltaproteobacteria bacterium]|nr:MAG: nucleotidyl transferase AbiEii/AbiGii toxin family protein [Deltaproteobacteria bacterium]